MSDELEAALARAKRDIFGLENELKVVHAALRTAERERDEARDHAVSMALDHRSKVQSLMNYNPEPSKARLASIRGAARSDERRRVLSELDGWFKALAEIGNDRGT